jgi:sugar diacid utilization regulator
MNPRLAGTRVVQDRPPNAGVDSRTPRTRRGGAEGALKARRAYTPCLVSWEAGEPSGALLDEMWRAAFEWDGRSLLVPLDSATQIILLAEDGPEGLSVERVRGALRSVLAVARSGRPEARIQAVVGDRIAAGERLAPAAARLRTVARRRLARPGDEVVWARRHSLAALLGTLDRREAAGFVDERLALLRTYDRQHGTDLQRVLELALDHRDRNTAASAAFMHRNTFRRQLGKALELVGTDLSDPEERLALHLALKLRGQLAR